MIKKICPKIENNKFFGLISKFLASYYSMLFVLIITCLSNLFSLEIFALYGYMLIILLSCLFGKDMLATIPVAFCGYICFSRQNNPASFIDQSIFLSSTGVTHLIIASGVSLIAFLTRLIFDLITLRGTFKKPKLTWGLLAIAITFIFGGIFTDEFGLHSIAVGAIEALSFCFVYFYFYYTVKWENVKNDYGLLLLMGVGIVMCFEIFGALHYSNFWNSEDLFDRDILYTGWGNYNNMGGMMVITICGPFYFACKSKHGFLYLLLANFFGVVGILTQSRSSIVFGLIIYGICLLCTLNIAKGKQKTIMVYSYAATMIILITIMFVFSERIIELFDSMLRVGFYDSGRSKIYQHGWEQFSDSPLVGKGFTACETVQWGNHSDNPFWPARYHNTYVQILATCGLIGLVAYIYHRVQTIKIVIKDFNHEKLFMAIGILAIILISLIDCHLFNVGPAIIYSGLLLFIEKQNKVLKAKRI